MNFTHRLLVLLPFLLLGAPAPTQQPPAEPGQIAVTAVEFDRGVGAPAKRLWMPLSLISAPGVRVGRLELTLAFPKALISFSDFESSGLTEGVDAEVKAEVRENERDSSQQLLILRISTLDGKATRIPLSDGKLAYVLFQVSADTPPNSTITVTASGTAVTVDDPPKPVEPFAVRVLGLEISEEPASSCFFYMH